MKPLQRDDILALDDYERVREDYRRRLIAHKQIRRVSVGDRVSLAFEDRETLRYQIQEMTRIERIREPSKLQHEIDTYNEVMPGENELSATLFIEIPELGQVRNELDRLIGIDEQVFLVLGEGGSDVRAQFDPGQMEEERISAVQYIRFCFSPEDVERFSRCDRARVEIRHPHYACAGEIGAETQQSLMRDLRDETPILLDPDRARSDSTTQTIIVYEKDEVRVTRPPRRRDQRDLVVEFVGDAECLIDLGPDRIGRLLEVVQRYTREISKSAGDCLVQCEVDSSGNLRPRWKLFAAEK